MVEAIPQTATSSLYPLARLSLNFPPYESAATNCWLLAMNIAVAWTAASSVLSAALPGSPGVAAAFLVGVSACALWLCERLWQADEWLQGIGATLVLLVVTIASSLGAPLWIVLASVIAVPVVVAVSQWALESEGTGAGCCGRLGARVIPKRR